MEYEVPSGVTCPFTDVDATPNLIDPLYPAAYVAVCALHGVTTGKTATTFAPWDPITREQLVTMAARAASLPDPPSDYAPPFAQGQFSLDEHYLNARKAEYAALLNGLQGIGPVYDFSADSTRGEVAQILRNLLSLRPAQLLTMIPVPAGTFQRDATVTNTSTVSAFSMSETEITRAQWTTVTGLPDPSDPEHATGTDDPVRQTNWYQALVFCNTLSLREGLTPVYTVKGSTDPDDWGTVPTEDGDTSWDPAIADWSADGYRLPTEMEWMWAAMGATSGLGDHTSGVFTNGYLKGFAGDPDPAATGGAIDDYAWYSADSGDVTHPVGTKLPNELGLYDMSGNMWEWCWDWWDYPDPYPSGSLTDYPGPASGAGRVGRGGAWDGDAPYCSVAFRGDGFPNGQYVNVGFRVVRR
jgi:formylglycine-generating enzyme required for sulfatase activity